jgi:hypothetical protein
MSYEAHVRLQTPQDAEEAQAARSAAVSDSIAAKVGTIDLPAIARPTRIAALARDMDIPAPQLRKAYAAAGYPLSRAEHTKSRYYVVHPRKKEA